jgi:hypothetical protein
LIQWVVVLIPDGWGRWIFPTDNPVVLEVFRDIGGKVLEVETVSTGPDDLVVDWSVNPPIVLIPKGNLFFGIGWTNRGFPTTPESGLP